MATVTLKYNARNLKAQKTIDYILSLGIFEKESPPSRFAESDNDIKKGRIYTAKNADDLIKQCLK